MKIFSNELRQARLARGIEEDIACAMFAMTGGGYYDLEHNPEEWLWVVPAYEIKSVVSFFALDWESCHDWKPGLPLTPAVELGRFISGVRTQNALTRDELADKVGFEVPFVEVIEGHPMGLALWPIKVSLLLCDALHLDSRSVVGRMLEIR